MTKSKPTTFAKLSTEFYKAFVRKTRDDKTVFYSLVEGSPEWMTDAVRAAHEALDGRFPDDWTYDACHTILSTLDDYGCVDGDVARENMHEIADGAVDVYNTARYAWLAMHTGNADLCDEAVSELGGDPEASIADRIGLGQYLAYTRIGEALIGAITEQVEAQDENA